jgi:DNA-binding transcriptional ArsR family regulator
MEPVEEPGRAELLLHPLRQRILHEARRASTAAEIARRLGLPPQKVNYHVRTLVDAGFLRPAGEGRKRNLVEKRYRASAASYLLLPQVVGDLAPAALPATDADREADRFSARHLMLLSARLQSELSSWFEPDDEEAARIPTLALDAEVRFESAEQRAAFAEALQEAITGVIRKHTSPARDDRGASRPGRPYRVVMGCYPIPTPEPGPNARGTDESTTPGADAPEERRP